MTGVVPSTSLCELGPCLVGVWVRGRVAGCCSACIAARGFYMTTGQSATSNAIALAVALRRRLCLAFPHPAAHGLLALIRLLRAFYLNVIERNRAFAGVNVNLVVTSGPPNRDH